MRVLSADSVFAGVMFSDIEMSDRDRHLEAQLSDLLGGPRQKLLF